MFCESTESNAERNQSISNIPVAAEARDIGMNAIAEYEKQSVANGDGSAAIAAISSITGGLMRIGLDLNFRLRAWIAEDSQTIKQMQKIVPALNAQLGVTRQVERFLALEDRMQVDRSMPRSTGNAIDSSEKAKI